MDKATCILRSATLIALCIFGFLFLLGEEADLSQLFIDKALAFAALGCAYRLDKRWSKTDETANSHFPKRSDK